MVQNKSYVPRIGTKVAAEKFFQICGVGIPPTWQST